MNTCAILWITVQEKIQYDSYDLKYNVMQGQVPTYKVKPESPTSLLKSGMYLKCIICQSRPKCNKVTRVSLAKKLSPGDRKRLARWPSCTLFLQQMRSWMCYDML